MVDYENTKIYYIAVDNKRYYGHTAQKYLSARQRGHRHRFNNGFKFKVYEEMRKLSMNDKDLICVWVEDYPCKSLKEAKSRERWWIEQEGGLNGTLNAKIPNRTRNEYGNDTKEQIQERGKKYRQTNKDKIREKNKAYREANGERISQQSKEYREKNVEKLQQYENSRRETRREFMKEWRKNNLDKMAEYYQRQKEKRRATNGS
jgi:hypothetical protein